MELQGITFGNLPERTVRMIWLLLRLCGWPPWG